MSLIAEDLSQDHMVDGLFVRSLGAHDAQPVLFSAGLGGSWTYWTEQAEALARDYFVILYDHRGTGHSSRAPLPAPYSIDHMAADMAAILRAVAGRPAHVVGHAAGGIAALELARMAPDLVSSLTVINGWIKADPHTVRCFEIRRDIYRAQGADGYLKAQPLFLYPATWISDHLEHLDAERALALSGFQDEATLFARMAALEGANLTGRLGEVQCPLLVMASADDMLVPPRASAEIAAELPRATLVTAPAGGHAVNITEPAYFDDQLQRFLRDPDGSACRQKG